MITKEDLKKVVDKLPENLLDEVYALLKQIIQQKKTPYKLTTRNFKGKLDGADIRRAAYV
jgi:hypothetical protein